MTHQETFDIVVAHLRKQGKKARSKLDSRCLYRMGELKCAAGCLIPDEEYDPEFEGQTCDNKPPISYKCKLVKDVLIKHGHDPKLVRELQTIHDSNEVDDWENLFKELAGSYDDIIYLPKPTSI